MTARATLVLGVLLATLGASCAPEPEIERRTTVEHGRDLFQSTSASGSSINRFSCATCHAAAPDDGNGKILPGFALAGAVQRSTFWGGVYDDLLRAMNDCRYYFMSAPRPWTAGDAEAQAIFAFLSSQPPAQPNALPMTVVKVAGDLPGGDAARGKFVFEASCQTCHGEVRTGVGKLRSVIPALPEEAASVFVEKYGFTKEQVRVTFVEKVRHGAFLGVYGSMPFYPTESLSDADLAALLAYMGL